MFVAAVMSNSVRYHDDSNVEESVFQSDDENYNSNSKNT